MQHSLKRAKTQLELECRLTTQQLRRLEQEIQEQGWASQAAQRQQQALGQKMERLAVARQRVLAGTYGYCSGCGQPIAAERLEAVPDTTLCVACKDTAVRSQMRSQVYTRIHRQAQLCGGFHEPG